jgi:hypothetical protein
MISNGIKNGKEFDRGGFVTGEIRWGGKKLRRQKEMRREIVLRTLGGSFPLRIGAPQIPQNQDLLDSREFFNCAAKITSSLGASFIRKSKSSSACKNFEI